MISPRFVYLHKTIPVNLDALHKDYISVTLPLTLEHLFAIIQSQRNLKHTFEKKLIIRDHHSAETKRSNETRANSNGEEDAKATRIRALPLKYLSPDSRTFASDKSYVGVFVL